MKRFDARKWASYVRKHNNPLVVAGDGCDRIVLEGTRLGAYAARVAAHLGCPVAATGNTILELRRYDGVRVKKMWLAELFRFLQDGSLEPFLDRPPDLLVLIGYRPEGIHGLVASLRNIHTVHLGPGSLGVADKTMEETTLGEWKRKLDDFVEALSSGGSTHDSYPGRSTASRTRVSGPHRAG
jgi:CO dehydrogenase/acetyl-CoA synthase epsilon subunit